MPNYVDSIKVGSGDVWSIRDAGALQREGGTMTGPVNMNDNPLINIPYPTKDGDAIPYGYDDPRYLHVSGGNEMMGDLPMNGYHITGLPYPESDDDAATKEYVDQIESQLSGLVISVGNSQKSAVIYEGTLSSGAVDISNAVSKYQAFVVTGYTVSGYAQTSVTIPTALLGKTFQLFSDGNWVSLATSTATISINNASSNGAITCVLGLI